MANLNITDLNPEFMAEAITNAKSDSNNRFSEISEKQAAKILCDFDTIIHVNCKCSRCTPIIVVVCPL